MSKISIYTLTHKQFNEKISGIYKPILNGSYFHKEDYGYIRDDTGDNISSLNSYYAELTGEYWAWKNSNSEIIGFCHYRRFLCKNLALNKLEEKDILNILDKYDMILPNKVHMGMSTLEDVEKTNKYLNVGPKVDEYFKLRDLIKKECPEYIDAYDSVLSDRSCYMFNMFIARREVADKYFEWLFNLLFKLEKEIDFDSYSKNNQRILGYLSERLLNVYIKYHNLSVKEKPLLVSDRKIPLIYPISYKIPYIWVLYKYYTKQKYLRRKK